MESLLTDRLATLSHPQRMAVFRLLMRRYPDEVPAGEIGRALGLKPSTTSVYLAALAQVGLVRQRRDGTRVLYRVGMDAAREVVAGLFVDCCRGRADLCPPFWPMPAAPEAADTGAAPAVGHAVGAGRALRVLFLCTGNSARSIFAEALLRDLGGDRFEAFSAGTAPRAALHPMAVELLRARGHDVTRLRPKGVDDFRAPGTPRMDVVLTVCDHAANEDCPAWPGQPLAGHWGVPDPALAEGPPEARRAAFAHAYEALRARITAFTALPFDTLTPGELQTRIDDIGKIPAPQE